METKGKPKSMFGPFWGVQAQKMHPKWGLWGFGVGNKPHFAQGLVVLTQDVGFLLLFQSCGGHGGRKPVFLDDRETMTCVKKSQLTSESCLLPQALIFFVGVDVWRSQECGRIKPTTHDRVHPKWWFIPPTILFQVGEIL